MSHLATETCPFCRKTFTLYDFTFKHQKLNGSCAPSFSVAPVAEEAAIAHDAHDCYLELIAKPAHFCGSKRCLRAISASQGLLEGGPYTPSTFSAVELLADVRRQYCGSAFEHHDKGSCVPARRSNASASLQLAG